MPYPYKSYRDWLAEEEKFGEVIRFKEPIKIGDYSNIVDLGNGIPGKIPETELRALSRYLHSLPGKPIGVIEKPVGNRSDIPIIINSWPGRERVLRGLGLKNKDELCTKMAQLATKKIPPKVVSREEAPCKQVVIRENEIDLRRDIPRCWVEFNQQLWSSCNSIFILYNPETKTHGLGNYRSGQFEWEEADPSRPCREELLRNHMAVALIYLGPIQSDGGKFYFENFRKKQKPMPFAIALSVPTDFHTIAASKASLKWPKDGDEYAALGGFRGEPVEVVPSETYPELMVPAHAEFIIEGEILPEDVKMPPYGGDIASGHMFGGELMPVMKIKCITHRRDPLWACISWSASGMNGHEGPHTGLYINFECEAINHLRNLGFKVKDCSTLWDCEVAVVQLEVDGPDKPYPHYGKAVAMSCYGNPGKLIGLATKYLIVVGPDVDPHDYTDVMWALGSRTMPVSDSIVIPKGLGQWGDPGALPGPLGWRTYGEQVLIDATIKQPERYDSWLPRSEPVDWEKAAIAHYRERFGAAGALGG
jgi:2,5-furandicarboxylate decarboxylase 1